MKHYRYDLVTADLDCGIRLHPQDDMNRLGFRVVKSEPVPVADCWWFRVENDIDNVPSYLFPMGDGFKFSDER